MATVEITLDKLLENNGALLSFGLELPMDFFANPAWKEMFFKDESGEVYLHPLGKYSYGESGKPILLPRILSFSPESATFSSKDKVVLIKEKNGQLYIESEYYDGSQFHGTQMIFGQEKYYFRVETFSYDLPLFLSMPSIPFIVERATSYFDALGLEVKRDKAYSVEYIPKQEIGSKEELISLLRSTAICKQYVSTIDQKYSLKEKYLLPGRSFISRMSYHRDEKRLDVAWIGPKEDKFCIHLEENEDTRLVKGRSNLVVPDMPEELDENRVIHFIDAASGDMEMKIALAKSFGKRGKAWLKKHEIILKK